MHSVSSQRGYPLYHTSNVLNRKAKSWSSPLSTSGSRSPPPSLTVCLGSQHRALSFLEGLTVKNDTVKAFLYIIMSLRNVFSTSLVLRAGSRAIRTNSKSDSRSLICLCCLQPPPHIQQDRELTVTCFLVLQKDNLRLFSFMYLVMGLCSALFCSEVEIGLIWNVWQLARSVSVSAGHRRSRVLTALKCL